MSLADRLGRERSGVPTQPPLSPGMATSAFTASAREDVRALTPVFAGYAVSALTSSTRYGPPLLHRSIAGACLRLTPPLPAQISHPERFPSVPRSIRRQGVDT